MEKKHLAAGIGIAVIAMFFAVSVFALSGSQNTNTQNQITGNAVATGKEVTVKLSFKGYDFVFEPASVNVGDRVTLVADMTKLRGCYSTFVMPEFGITKTFRLGDNTYTFVASRAGTFPVTCGMGMAGGQFTVK